MAANGVLMAANGVLMAANGVLKSPDGWGLRAGELSAVFQAHLQYQSPEALAETGYRFAQLHAVHRLMFWLWGVSTTAGSFVTTGFGAECMEENTE
jgi:hypothetical protein